MNRTVAAAVVLVLAGAGPARGQIIDYSGNVYVPGVVYGPGIAGYAYRGGYGFGGPGYGFGGRFVQRGFYASPFVPYPAWVAVAGPGWGPGYGNPFFLQQTADDLSSYDLGSLANVLPRPRPASAPPKPDDYIIISPKGQYPPPQPKSAATPKPAQPTNPAPAKGTITPKIDRVASRPQRPDRPQVPRIGFDPFPKRRAQERKTDSPEAVPAAEAARQLKQAGEAFAAEEYGAAVEHLDRAVRAKPDAPLPHFVKGQAQFATGQYDEAVASIRDGLKLAPNWPASGFRPKAMYGDQPARFDTQLADLRKAVAANPTEPALQFLLAYELWFGGDRVEAAKLFRDLADRVKDTAPVEPFLKAKEK
jgi:hypothetical protein